MMTPERAAEEERRFQGQKILASAVRFHSHLATQLCFGGRDPESPSLVKFDAGRWQLEQSVRKVVDGWRYVLTHAHSRKPIGTPKNDQPKNDPLSFYEPQSLAIHQYDKGVAIPIQNWFFSQDKPNQSDKASGSKMPDPEVSQEDTESTHHPKQ